MPRGPAVVKQTPKPSVRTCVTCSRKFVLPAPGAQGVAGNARCPHCRELQRLR